MVNRRNNMTFTLTQLLQIFLTLCGSIITIGGAGAIILKAYDKRKKPSRDALEMIKKHTEQLDNDNKRLKELEEGNKVVMQSLLAIMSHLIDGNHTEELKKSKEMVQEYLIKR